MADAQPTITDPFGVFIPPDPAPAPAPAPTLSPTPPATTSTTPPPFWKIGPTTRPIFPLPPNPVLVAPREGADITQGDIDQGRRAAQADRTPPPPLNKPLLPTTQTVGPPLPLTGLPNWKRQTPAQLQSTAFGPASSIVVQLEDQYRNIPQQIVPQSVSTASGYFQITDSTWRDFAPNVGVNLNRWPRAMDAPPQVQAAVAASLPLSRWDANPRAVRAVLTAFPWATESMTLGQIDAIAQRFPNQRYILARDIRPFSDWGKRPDVSDEYSGPGYLPTNADVPAIMARGRRAQPWLSSNTGFSNNLMLNSWAGYANAALHGQLLDAIFHRENWEQNLNDSVARMEEEGMDMASAYAAYQYDPGQLEAVMHQIANKYGDGILHDVAHDPDAVQRLMTARDQYFRDLSKTGAAQQKADAAAADRRERTDLYRQNVQSEIQARKANTDIAQQRLQLQQQKQNAGVGSGYGDGGGLTSDGKPVGPIPPADTAQPETESPAPPMTATPPPADEGTSGDGSADEQSAAAPEQTQRPTAPGTQPEGTQLAAADAPVTDADREVTQDEGPALQRQPQSFQFGGKHYEIQPGSRADAALGRALTNPEGAKQFGEGSARPDEPMIQAYYDRLAKLQQLANDPSPYMKDGKVDRQAYENAVSAIDPTIGMAVKGLLNRTRALPGGTGFGASLQPFSQMLADLTQAADPTWTPQIWPAMEKFRDPSGVTQQNIQLAGTLARTSSSVLRDVQRINWQDSSLKQAFDSWRATGKGDPRFTTLINDWASFVIEANRLRTRTGSVTESEQQIAQMTPRQLIESVLWRGTVPSSGQQFRDNLQNELFNSYGKIQGVKDQWSEYGSIEKMPGWHVLEEPDQIFDAITHMNFSTGDYTGIPSIPNELRGTGKLVTIPTDLPSPEGVAEGTVAHDDKGKPVAVLQKGQWVAP